MRDSNFIEKAFSVLLGLVFGLFSFVWWVVCSIGKLVHRVSIDILKNIYARVVAILATLLLIGLGLSSLAHLPH